MREITELFLGFLLGESIGDMIACSLVVAAKSVARVTLDLHMKIMGRGNGHDVRKIIRILGTGASVEGGTFFMITADQHTDVYMDGWKMARTRKFTPTQSCTHTHTHTHTHTQRNARACVGIEGVS